MNHHYNKITHKIPIFTWRSHRLEHLIVPLSIKPQWPTKVRSCRNCVWYWSSKTWNNQCNPTLIKCNIISMLSEMVLMVLLLANFAKIPCRVLFMTYSFFMNIILPFQCLNQYLMNFDVLFALCVIKIILEEDEIYGLIHDYDVSIWILYGKRIIHILYFYMLTFHIWSQIK